MPLFVITHRPEDEPAEGGFTFVNGLDEAIARAREAGGGKDVGIGGGADVIRQALRAGHVEELSISIAPVILGGGKRLFDGFVETVNLEHVGLLQSPLATHITYRIVSRAWAGRPPARGRRFAGGGFAINSAGTTRSRRRSWMSCSRGA